MGGIATSLRPVFILKTNSVPLCHQPMILVKLRGQNLREMHAPALCRLAEDYVNRGWSKRGVALFALTLSRVMASTKSEIGRLFGEKVALFEEALF